MRTYRTIRKTFLLPALLIYLTTGSRCFGADIPVISSKMDKIVVSADWRITKDPSPKDALQNVEDSLWEPFIHYDRYYEGNWLFKADITVKDTSVNQTAIGLFASYFITAFEIYWDGGKIAQNGVIGINEADEKPGVINYEMILPNRLLSPGRHTILLRISNYHDYTKWKWFNGQLTIGPYAAEIKNAVQFGNMVFFTAGIMMVPFLFFLFLFIARKGGIDQFIFCLICFVIILDHTAWQIQYILDLPSTYVYWTMYILRLSRILRSILFPIFLIFHFSIPQKKLLIPFIIVFNVVFALFVVDFWNLISSMGIALLAQSALITLWATVKKRDGSIIIFIGLVLAWIALKFPLMGTGSIIVIFSSLSIAKQFVKKEREEREAKLRSARLENELLKKNINPHFLLNTLTSIIAWLRRNPRSVGKFIEALADEFKIVTQISSLKLIPIRQEIDLCRTHLEIMSYRSGTNFELRAEDIEWKENVPPMVFHTLIENGLTHGFEERQKGVFTINRKKMEWGIQYILTHDGKSAYNSSKKSAGLGMRYVRARLEESYPKRWKLTSGKDKKRWKTIIEIRNK